MDFIKTWEEQLAFLETQANALRLLIDNQRAFMGNGSQPIKKAESKVSTTTATTTLKVDRKKPIVEQLVDIFNDCNVGLNNKTINELYENSSNSTGFNSYLTLKNNKPSVFSIVKYNNDNQKVFWILTEWIKNGLLPDMYRPTSIPSGLPYEINPVEPPRKRTKKQKRS